MSQSLFLFFFLLLQFNLNFIGWLVSETMGFRRSTATRWRVWALSKDPRVARLPAGMYTVRIPRLQPIIHGSSARP